MAISSLNSFSSFHPVGAAIDNAGNLPNCQSRPLNRSVGSFTRLQGVQLFLSPTIILARPRCRTETGEMTERLYRCTKRSLHRPSPTARPERVAEMYHTGLRYHQTLGTMTRRPRIIATRTPKHLTAASTMFVPRYETVSTNCSPRHLPVTEVRQ